MPPSINFPESGAASPSQVAIWVCGVALVILLGRIISKTKEPCDLRFLTYSVLAGVFAILGFAYLSADSTPSSKNDAVPPTQKAPITHPPPHEHDNLGMYPNDSCQNAKPPLLPCPHSGAGMTNQ